MGRTGWLDLCCDHSSGSNPGGAERVHLDMNGSPRTLAVVATAGLTLLLAGCGGGAKPASGDIPATVSVRSVDGVGSVLVDRSGATLYTPAQEAGGAVRCTGRCTSFWPPLTLASGRPAGSSDVTGKLAVVARPGGDRQVTYDGRPLYRFAQDGGPGQSTGNGVHDRFGGTSFSWSAVTVKGAAKPSPSKGGGGYGY